MKKIKLSQGKYAMVDNEDFGLVNAFKWHYDASNGYATRIVFEVGKTHETRGVTKVYMHRFILGTPKGSLTDHKNGNRLDNRRANLRIATPSQNQANRSSKKQRGAYLIGARWRAKIKVGGVTLHLGYFSTRVEALAAYNRKASEVFGDFALLNKV